MSTEDPNAYLLAEPIDEPILTTCKNCGKEIRFREGGYSTHWYHNQGEFDIECEFDTIIVEEKN